MASQTFSIKLTANGKEVQELQEALRKQANEYEKQLDQINEKLKDRNNLSKEEIKDLTQQSNSLAAKIKALGTAVEENITNLRKVDDVMKNLSGSSGAELGKALRGIGQQMKRVSDQTLKSGETMEQKLTEIKEKMIEVRHEMAKREGIDGLTRAKASLQDLANTPLDKLKMGLDSIEKKLSTMSEAERKAADGMTLIEGRARYRAQMAVTEQGRAGNADITKMNADQLRAEQQRLRTGYMATDGAKGYEAISQEYLNRLQQVNQTIKERAEAERIADKATRERIATQEQEKQVVDVLTRVNQQQKVTLDELRQSEKFLQDQIARMEGQNLPFADQNKLLQAKASLQDIQETISHITLDHINFDSLENEPVEELEKLLKQLETDEKRLAATDKQASEQMAANKRKVQQAIQRVKNQTIDLADAQKVASERGKHSAQDMQRAYDTLKQHLATLSTSQKKEIAETRQQMKQLKADIDSVTGAVSNQNSVWSTAVRNITAYVGVFGAFNFVKSKLQEVIRGGEELSDQMAQIRMVSGLTMNDIEELTRRMAKMDTRTTLQELGQIAYAGAKLGFGEQGIQGLEEFTRAANQVNVALREDLGEEALTALSKITENMGLIKKMGVEDAMLATSSAMFKLAATSTAAAGPIVEVTKRLAPVAQMSGFATHEILALASASDSLQLMPEVVGTALSKLIMAMQNNHNLIEKYLTIPEGTIASMFKAGQSMDALMLVFEKMSGKNVTELDGLWKLLGSDGQRLITVVADMANHTDTLAKHLDTSTKAFKEATAVTEEYNIQQETAMAYLLRAQNLWRNAFINPDSSLSVKEMTKAWYDFTKSILSSDVAMGGIKLSVDALLLSIRLLIALLPAITFGLLAKGAAMLVERMKLAKIATDGFTLSWKKMDAATKSNWIGLIVGGLVQLVYWTKEWISSTSDAEKEQKKLSAAIESMHEKQDQEIANLIRLKNQLDNTNISQEERNALLSKVRSDYDIYLNYLGIEKNAVTDLTKHYDALVKVMKQRFAYQEREDYKRDVMGGEDGLRMKRRNAGSSLSKFGKSQNVDVDLDMIQTYVKNGKSAEQIMELMFPDINRAVNATNTAETAARTAAGPGAAIGRRSSGSQQNIDFKKMVQGYVTAITSEINKEAEIDAAFASEIGDFDYDKWLRTQVTGEFKVKPDKAAATSAKDHRLEKLRSDFKQSKEDAEGLIAKIDEWYNLQEAAVKDAEAMGEMSKTEADNLVKAMEVARNESLMRARKAVGSSEQQAADDWQNWAKTVLPTMLADSSKWSVELMESIQKVDAKALHDFLKKFNGSKAMAKLDASSFLDTIMKKGAESGKKAAVLRAQFNEEMVKLLDQYRPIDVALRKMSEDLKTIGFISETYEQQAARLAAGVESPDEWRNRAQQTMENRFNANYGIGGEKPEDMQKWFMEFTDNGQAEWAKTLPALQRWVQDTDKYKEQIDRLYELLKLKERGRAVGDEETVQSASQQINKAVGNAMTDQQAYAQAGYKFVGQGTIPYTIDITNQQEALQWLKQFATDGQGEIDSWAQTFPKIAEWVERIKSAEREDGTIGEAELAAMQEAMPQIEALYMRMINFSDQVGKNIEQQVNAMMPSRAPIGTEEMRQQYEQRRDLTTSLYQQQIDQANAQGGPVDENGDNAAAIELKRQRDQTLIDMEYQYQQQLWQIREQMGVTWQDEYENEVAKYKNMLDKKLISEKEFQKKKGQLQAQLGLKYGQYYNGLMSNLVNALQEAEIASVEAKYEAQINAAQAAGQDTAALEEQKEAEIYEVRKKYAGMQFAVKISEIIANTAVAIMQAFASLPTPAAIVATALISATGAAQLAIAKAEYDKVMNGGVGKKSSSAKKSKLASGMLTYDEGNVQSVAVSRRQNRYLGDDGRVYSASSADSLPDGVSLVRSPIATTVNGHNALVAERGPEIVIGRRATRHIQMNEPGLLRHLAAINGHYRTHDDGTGVPYAAVSQQPQADLQEQNARLAAALDQNTQMMAAFVQMMNTIQQRGIPAHINKYGRGGLIDEVQSGMKFAARYGK